MYARDNVAGAFEVQQQPVSDAVVDRAVVTFAMLADATRLRLLAGLLDGERDVTALTAAVGAARPAVSQHLGKLRLAGLVAVRREGRRAVYTVAGPHVRRLVVEALYAAEHQVSDRPAHHAAPITDPSIPGPR
jgi:DNA-binding transcriptional ArsR family regulator